MPEPLHILVIDDEASIRESLCAFLEDHGYLVKAVESAEDALALLQHERFDLAIVDMRLPGESGDVFIVKAARLMKELRFLIHTGSVEFHLTDALKQQGITAEHVYLKPLNDLTVLVEGVEKLLNETD